MSPGKELGCVDPDPTLVGQDLSSGRGEITPSSDSQLPDQYVGLGIRKVVCVEWQVPIQF